MFASASARSGNGQKDNAKGHERGTQRPEDVQLGGQTHHHEGDAVGEKYEAEYQKVPDRKHCAALQIAM
ncbi:hypothetical protein [Aeromonas veronii]|uniref:hypothetical protein n=1 Tax=Aeromonas veronii TaxID=654 RepID=UPI0032EF879E